MNKLVEVLKENGGAKILRWINHGQQKGTGMKGGLMEDESGTVRKLEANRNSRFICLQLYMMANSLPMT